MSKLISGKEALIALANGENVQLRNLKDTWYEEWTDYDSFKFKIWVGIFIEGVPSGYEFRLKPRTITINGIEVPAPFEPACSEDYFFIVNSTFGYASSVNVESPVAFYGKWRTEEEIKQVVAALRSVFKTQ